MINLKIKFLLNIANQISLDFTDMIFIKKYKIRKPFQLLNMAVTLAFFVYLLFKTLILQLLDMKL